MVTGTHQDAPMKNFHLTLAQGKCILDINMYLGQNCQQIDLVVPISVTIKSLEEMIFKSVNIPDLATSNCMILSYNRRELPDDSFLFEAFQSQRRVPELIVDASSQNRQLRSVFLHSLIEMDRMFVSQFERSGSYRHFSIDTLFKKFNISGRIQSVGMDFRFNQLRQVVKVKWKEEAPWYREV